MFSLVCYGYLTGQLLSGMEELFMLLVMAFFKVTDQKAYLSVNKVRKILILTTGIFSVKAQQISQFF